MEEDLGKNIDDVFKRIDTKPIASASIAQVYKAVLQNGETVAVKVRRPNIEKIIKTDIEIMLFLAKLIEKHVKYLRKFKPVGIVEEFSEWTEKELNFNIEAQNIMRFHANFSGSKTTKIPRVYEKYISERVIVMEFLDGIELHRLEGKHIKGIDMKKALQNGFYSILEQVFIFGFFHADPHPSNIFVMKDNKVGFVDFGIIGCFDDELKEKASDIFMGIAAGDARRVTDALLDLGTVSEQVDVDELRKKVNEVIYPFQISKIKDINTSKALEEVLDIALNFGIRIPKEFVLFGKAIVTIEGIALRYYPDFEFRDTVEPFIVEIIEQRYEPKRMIKKGLMDLLRLRKSIDKIPTQATRVLDKLEQGKIRIEMRDTDIEKLSVDIDRSSNRLTYGLIIAAFLISGSLTINIGNPIFLNLPLISLICFAGAMFLTLMLIVSILGEGRY